MRKKLVILLVILLILAILSLLIGRYNLSIVDIFNIITGQEENNIKQGVFLNIRLPRVLYVIVAGGALALAGFIYQTIFKNSLASPDILGVSTGAACGAIVAILFFNSNKALIQISAFAISILTVFIALFLARVMKGNKLYNLVIAGIIISALGNSVIMYLKYLADPERELQVIDYWLMGSFQAITWQDLLITSVMVIPSLVVLIILAKKIKLLTLSEEEAISLGLNVKVYRLVIITLATILVSAVISIVGIVSWLGLIVPHIAKRLFKGSFKSHLINSIILGAIILLIADTIARSISETEIPISILTTLLGAITLTIIMIRGKSQ